jgi:hypothetical protein
MNALAQGFRNFILFFSVKLYYMANKFKDVYLAILIIYRELWMGANRELCSSLCDLVGTLPSTVFFLLNFL